MRRKQHAETPANDCFSLAVRVEGESKSRAEIISIVFDRIIERTRRPEVKLAPIGGRRQVLDHDGDVTSGLYHIVRVEVIPETKIDNQLLA